MVTRSASDVRKNFAEAVTSEQVEPVVIERRGRREAVLIAPEFFD
ncbi:MAG TPA: type II toxin-antitoxin system Phd/YefM family antitoxin [Marmoricola sp.]|nr:type II toxin-antitoxin system Phd/YefM family antitoxin [Marmoricola sp.]HNI71130.1 type II toxin-antitoxin system Phd/YefM family antitoxin [Marmoricola sp.]HNN47495.1 type II toxin-antitoxin system Phd/YefM family antitoxin [Marmoricola sp.]HNO39549.1 type II toxin-antitoxin system Phd/YefM family antitoxin [Marmoricola sp.]